MFVDKSTWSEFFSGLKEKIEQENQNKQQREIDTIKFKAKSKQD